MKLSSYLLKTYKGISSEEKSINAQYLIRGWFVDQLMSWVYTLLPLGLRVTNKIQNIIREEMNAIWAYEIHMPSLQPKANWEQTWRWESVDCLFRFESYYSKTEYALGPSHEEVVMPLLNKFIASYADLPKAVYQFQTKFRDEKRAKSGVLRGREFTMKDCYSFHTDAEDLERYYEIQKQAYLTIFRKMWISDTTYLTYASGGTFSKYSHEFQTVCEAGEDTIYLIEDLNIAINKEIIDDTDVRKEFDLDNRTLKELKTIEVGNIFKLNTKFSTPFDLCYTDTSGTEQVVYTGCYGIGIERLMWTIVEAYHDEKWIVRPEAVAPFRYVVIWVGPKGLDKALEVYTYLLKQDIEVVLDDRDVSFGFKMNDAELIWYPYQIVISDATLAQWDTMVELVRRKDGDKKVVDYTAYTSF